MKLPKNSTGSITVVGDVTITFISPSFREMLNLKAACVCPIKAIGERYVRLLVEDYRRSRKSVAQPVRIGVPKNAPCHDHHRPGPATAASRQPLRELPPSRT